MKAILSGAVFLALAVWPAAAGAGVAGDQQRSLFTRYAVLVGSADSASTSVLVLVPGTFVLTPDRPELLKYSEDLADLKTELKRSFRLESLDTFASTGVELVLGQEYIVKSPDAAAPGADLGVAVTLTKLEGETATFSVRLFQKDHELAEPVVKIERGGRAIVGKNAGADRQVFVVLVVPRSQPQGSQASGVSSKPAQMPRVLVEEKPQYTSELLHERLAGKVVLTCTVGIDGRTSDPRVVESTDQRFNPQALEALKHWIFEPARDASGKAIPFSVTIEFTFTPR